MDFIDQIITPIIESFDFGYCASVNVLTYIVIKLLDELNGERKVTSWQKRGVLLGVIVIVGFLYCDDETPFKVIVNSAILAPVFWTWLCKPICKKFNIDYKQDVDDTNSLV